MIDRDNLTGPYELRYKKNNKTAYYKDGYLIAVSGYDCCRELYSLNICSNCGQKVICIEVRLFPLSSLSLPFCRSKECKKQIYISKESDVDCISCKCFLNCVNKNFKGKDMSEKIKAWQQRINGVK